MLFFKSKEFCPGLRDQSRVFVFGFFLGVAALAGCTPQEPPAPATPVRDEAAVRRDWLFGARAEAADIDWRPSGLGIRMIKPGEGTPPTSMDRIRVHYVLTLKDGRVVDDSHAKGKPSDFTVSRLITGWAAGMAELKPGGRAEFFIPPSLGYGNMSVGGIPSGSGLIFDVELIAVNPEVPPKS
jgi:FKBP-type peptidyl-prolyl cis-trans isomerase FklB